MRIEDPMQSTTNEVYAVKVVPSNTKGKRKVIHYKTICDYPEVTISIMRNKKRLSWTFDPITVKYVADYLKEGLSEDEINKKAGIPIDMLESLVNEIQKLESRRDKKDAIHKDKRRRRSRSSNSTKRRKNNSR
jgi:hypothetical protein